MVLLYKIRKYNGFDVQNNNIMIFFRISEDNKLSFSKATNLTNFQWFSGYETLF